MKLKDYLFENNIDTKDFAKTVGTNKCYLSSCINRKRPFGRGLASRIEKATDGQVTMKELMFPERILVTKWVDYA
jgi:DNA-binding transcriptional regulator YdaS (Cro superfamily)